MVETASIEGNEEEVMLSDLFTSIMKDVEVNQDGVVGARTFYLADTEAFCDPCCVIPNLGRSTNAYFVVKPRNQWANEFILWMESQHTLDEMDEIGQSDEIESETED